MTPMIEAAEREELAKWCDGLATIQRNGMQRQVKDGEQFGERETDAQGALRFARIATLLRQSAAAPVVTGEPRGDADLALAIRQAVREQLPSRSDGRYWEIADAITQNVWRALQAALSVQAPIDMVLFCPKCGEQHIDAAKGEWNGEAWTNPPHRSHLCHACGHIWRPADVPTNGVAATKTKGKADSPLSVQGVGVTKPFAWVVLYENEYVRDQIFENREDAETLYTYLRERADHPEKFSLVELYRSPVAALTHSGRGVAVDDQHWVRHKKRGTVYQVMYDTAILQATGNKLNDARAVIYRDEEGQVWVRPYDEFHDGRFERAAAPEPDRRE